MKSIPLTPLHYGHSTIVDDEDYEWLNRFTWRWMRTPKSKGWAGRSVNVAGKTIHILMHREIMNAPVSMVVDHVNHDMFDNRRANLRLCAQSENLRNQRRRKDNTSGYKGVCWVSKPQRWFAQIHVNGKKIHLGSFKTKEEAAAAYAEGAKKYHGKFSHLG